MTLLVFTIYATQIAEDVLGKVLFDDLGDLEVLAPLERVRQHLARICDLKVSTCHRPY